MIKLIINLSFYFIFSNTSIAQEVITSSLEELSPQKETTESNLNAHEEILSSVPLEEINNNQPEKGGIFDFIFGTEKIHDHSTSFNDIEEDRPTHILVERFNEGSFYPSATIQIIDRSIGKVYNLLININKTELFNDLEIKVLSCWQPTRNTITPQSKGLFQINSSLPTENDLSNKLKPIFKGWLIASNPAASYVKHSKFDISLRNCVGTKQNIQKLDENNSLKN